MVDNKYELRIWDLSEGVKVGVKVVAISANCRRRFISSEGFG